MTARISGGVAAASDTVDEFVVTGGSEVSGNAALWVVARAGAARKKAVGGGGHMRVYRAQGRAQGRLPCLRSVAHSYCLICSGTTFVQPTSQPARRTAVLMGSLA